MLWLNKKVVVGGLVPGHRYMVWACRHAYRWNNEVVREWCSVPMTATAGEGESLSLLIPPSIYPSIHPFVCLFVRPASIRASLPHSFY